MKVLWFSNTPSLAYKIFNYKYLGGGWIQGIEYAVNKYSNWELSIVFDTNSKHGNYEEISKYYPVKRKNFKLIRGIRKQFGVLREKENLFQYLSLIDMIKPDIIQIFGTEGPYIEILPYIKTIPIVIHIQGILSDCQKIYFGSASRKDIIVSSKLIDLIRATTPLHSKMLVKKYAKRELKYLPMCKYYLGRTSYDKNFIRKYAPRSMYFVGNEVLRPEFYSTVPSKRSLKKEFIILTTNNGDLYKGLDIVLQTAQILKNQKFNFRWLLVGVNQNSIALHIFQRKLGIKIGDVNVSPLGQLNVGQLIDQLLIANLFIHPSLIDNSPNSICEAQILGIPVLASNVGGIPSLIDDDFTGYLSTVDPQDIAYRVMSIQSNYEHALNIGNNAREMALRRHDPMKNVEELNNVYLEILEGK